MTASNLVVFRNGDVCHIGYWPTPEIGRVANGVPDCSRVADPFLTVEAAFCALHLLKHPPVL